MPKKLIKKAQDSLPDDAPEGMKNFLEIFYGKLQREDIKAVKTQDLVETARLHWNLSRKRKKNKPIIEIHNKKPSSKEHLGHTVIDIVNDDMAFLVDSVVALITAKYKLINILIHPIIHIKKDKQNRIISTDTKPGEDTIAQSHIHIELQGTIPQEHLNTLKKEIGDVLSDVYLATRDWQKMRKKLREAQKDVNRAPVKYYSDNEVEDYIGFLEYLYKDNFTLLGYREYKTTETQGDIKTTIVKNSGLGLLQDSAEPVYISENADGLPQNLARKRHQLPPVTVAKVNKKSTVHRSVPFDAIAIKSYDDKGRIVGEKLFIGLFTSVTYSRSIRDVPLLRRKTDKVTKMSGFRPNSHGFKALRHILEKYPRDELFQIDEETLLEYAISIMHLQERQRIALYTRADPFGRYVSCLVYVPRDRYDTSLRMRMKNILEQEIGGTCESFYTNVDDSPLARVLYIIYVKQKKKLRYDGENIEKQLQEAGRTWGEKLAAALKEELDEEGKIARIAYHYGEAFPVNYTHTYTAKQCYFDILKINEALDSGKIAIDLYKPKNADKGQIRLKMFQKSRPIPLSDILPILENMGLSVDSEIPFEVRPAHSDESIWIHDFKMEPFICSTEVPINDIKDKFEQALIETWYDRVENDALNQLVMGAGLTYREVMILRTYIRYMRQMRYHFGTRYIERALVNNPEIACHLIELFDCLHNPKKHGKNKENAAGCSIAIQHAIEKVQSLDEDRILRRIENLITATLRTNFYQKDTDGLSKSYISVKLDSGKIDALPKPVPHREIFVYSPRVEAIHLRGDKIARGGIRWSDREEDFRTEVLDLMKAQQVKNAVIIPMGAKGGFIVKNPPPSGDRKARQDEGIACYKVFIRGLLDITDNRDGKKIISPQDVVCHDGEDPYLVVAADKGTASFSDIANEISNEYGFWLGDAFASGGSAGYDHKEMGITARGAWESVKRHFRELNHDTQKEDFDVIGVGDMSGDVFGNGMLLSKHIRLIGAFNHLHIFCDPDPDPANSFKERKRLFQNALGWNEYDKRILSKGGRIYSRSDKSLALTPEIQKSLNIDNDRVTPYELMQAMLMARTDLLWFGGIGTYIKSSDETHTDVGDKSNDLIRINAKQVKAKVIAEGANLAVTQKGRIEYARKGGRINADFIDNSGGVNSSDLEVNIKILFSELMNHNNSRLSLKQRNLKLKDMTEEVAKLVLRNNYQQVQGISLTEYDAAENLYKHAQFISDLDEKHDIDREIEHFPVEEEIEQLSQKTKGLTRPEIGLLHSYAKILLTKDIINSDITDEPAIYDYWLIKYFPRLIRENYRKAIKKHRLKREILATTIANSVVNRMGPIFVKEQMERTGADTEAIIKSLLIVREIFGARELWHALEKLDNKVPATIQIKAMREVAAMIERETIWFLTRLGRSPDLKTDLRIFDAGVAELQACINEVVTRDMRRDIRHRTEMNIEHGLPKAIARKIALIPTLGAACDIIKISRDCKQDIKTAAQAYFETGEVFRINWLRKQAVYMTASDHWSEEALNGLIEQLLSCQAGLTTHILSDHKIMKQFDTDAGKGGTPVTLWRKAYQTQIVQMESILNEIYQSGSIDIPMLLIAEQRLRHLYGG